MSGKSDWRVPYLRLGLRLHIRIHRERHRIRFIDRRRLRILRRESIALLQRNRLQVVYPLHQLVELVLQLLVVAYVEGRFHHQVERMIEVLPRRIQVTSVIVRLPGLIFLLYSSDQILNLIGRSQRHGSGLFRLRALG